VGVFVDASAQARLGERPATAGGAVDATDIMQLGYLSHVWPTGPHSTSHISRDGRGTPGVQCDVEYRSTDSFSCASPSRFIFSYVELCPFRYDEKPALSGLSSTATDIGIFDTPVTRLYTHCPLRNPATRDESLWPSVNHFFSFCLYRFRFLNNFFLRADPLRGDTYVIA
jgi:hypothetical protein